jgi:hypothetical protein
MARTQLAGSMKVTATQSVWPRSLALRVLSAIWVLPVALLGCAGVMAFVLLGWAQPVISEGALDVVATGPLALWMADRHWGAFTFGPCIWYWTEASAASEHTRCHEREHVRQYLRWGPLMLIAYPIASVWVALRGGDFYRDNTFERAARAAADK